MIAAPLSRHYAKLQPALDDAYRRVMNRGVFILGPELEAFEREFAEYCGTRYCIGVGNGLDALQLILRVAGIGRGDEVLVPANTFIATWLAVSLSGARPVPVEPDPRTCNIDPAAMGQAGGRSAKAVIAVHLYGLPAAMQEVTRLAAERDLLVIEDAAQAHGARYLGQRVGGLGFAAAFSFYPVKNLGAFGDGGAVTTDDADVAREVRRARDYGSSAKYRHEVLGLNSRLDELQAAFLRVKLAQLDRMNGARTARAAEYARDLSELSDVLELPAEDACSVPVWHQYVVRTQDRDGLQAALRERGISTLVHYPVPPHLQPAYAVDPVVGAMAGRLPVTERLAATCLSLPIDPFMEDDEQQAVIQTVRGFFGRSRSRSGSARQTRIESYATAYLDDYGFESKLVEYRQKVVLEWIEQHRPATLVEVGCGADLLYSRACDAGVEVERWIVIEPSEIFASQAEQAARSAVPLQVLRGFFEDSSDLVRQLTSHPVDMLVMSGLLNEVERPQELLAVAKSLLAPNGLLHVNVPNARSFHRRLAKAMGLIDNMDDFSARNRSLKQFRVFDRHSLAQLLERAGFSIEIEGGYFIKPFSHAQMETIPELLDGRLMDGLQQMGRELPELASEIYVNARVVP